MRGLTKDEKASTLDAFVDTSASDLDTVDRSDLEAWSVCPWQAKARADGRCKVVGIAAEAGEAIHQCLSAVTRTWVESDIDLPPYEARDMLKTDLEFELRRVRPDVQPEALKGMMPAAWAWCSFLSKINPGNILAFDGGEDVGRSAQYAYDFPELGTRVTSELDLVYANPQTVELIEWFDYKSGYESYSEDSIAERFQFQMHAMLLLHHFPDVKAARLRIWETRKNRVSYTVTFPRQRFDDYLFRVRSAAEIRRRHWDSPPTWPTAEKCPTCPAAAICPVAQYPIPDAPESVLRDLIAVEARADALKQRLAAHVDATGQDVRVNGVAFGRNKPAADRKKPISLYDLKE